MYIKPQDKLKFSVGMFPKSSCLIKLLEIKFKELGIEFETFEDLNDLSQSENKYDFIINFANPKESSTKGAKTYSESVQDTINYIEVNQLYKTSLVIASSVGIKPKYINLGDKAQIKYNLDRSKAEKIFIESNTGGLILRIPLVSCREDSLLKRFKNGTTTEKDLKNKRTLIPVQDPETFINTTIQFLTSFHLAKEIQLNTLVIEYDASEYSIEMLQNSLANSKMLDYLIDHPRV